MVLEAAVTKLRSSDANLLYQHWLQIYDFMCALVFNCVLETTCNGFHQSACKREKQLKDCLSALLKGEEAINRKDKY